MLYKMIAYLLRDGDRNLSFTTSFTHGMQVTLVLSTTRYQPTITRTSDQNNNNIITLTC